MSKSTVVVIGSGPGPSTMTGADIDKHVVVRMWNHEWQPADRYGSRYDYGLITRSDDVDSAKRRPNKAWFFYNVPHEPEVEKIDGHPVTFLNYRRWYAKADAIGAKAASENRALKFTRGFAAVAGAIDILRPQRVIVIGMSILRDGQTGDKYFDPAALPYYVKTYSRLAKSQPKWAADQMPAGVRGEGPHDYTAESKIVRQIAEDVGTEIVWE